MLYFEKPKRIISGQYYARELVRNEKNGHITRIIKKNFGPGLKKKKKKKKKKQGKGTPSQDTNENERR